MNRHFLLLTALLVLWSAAGKVLGAHYDIIDLGTLGGSSVAYGINASGQVVGASYIDPGNTTTHAFLYSDGTMTDLGTLGGSSSSAKGINASGQVVGAANLPDGTNHAFLWSSGQMTDLGGLSSGANGINASGQVVGWAYFPGKEARHAFLWSNGHMSDLGTLASSYGAWSEARGINACGQVVGGASLPGTTFSSHPFLWDPWDGHVHDLVALLPGRLSGSAYGINDCGEVVGNLRAEGYPYVAFIYSYGRMSYLASPSGTATFAAAQAVNNWGQIVGYFTYADPAGGTVYDPFLYSGQMSDLNAWIDPASGWTLEVPYGINDAGQIAGWGYHNGQQRAFLMTPIPEPSTFALLATAAAGMLAFGVRRRGKRKVVSRVNCSAFVWRGFRWGFGSRVVGGGVR